MAVEEGSNVKWYGDEVLRKIEKGMRHNMERAAIFLERDIKKSFPGSGQGAATKAERQATRSAPGEIPHVQTGTLRRGLGHDVIRKGFGKIIGRVGLLRACMGKNLDAAKALVYGLFLEIGTSKMEKRPYLRPGLDRNRTKLRSILCKRILG